MNIQELKKYIDYFGPYEVARICAEWNAEHAPTVQDRDWRAEYELLAEAFTRIANRNWNFEREEK